MKKKIGTYIFLVLILFMAIFPFIDKLFDKIYLNREYAYTISEQIIFGVGNKAGAHKRKYLFKIKDKFYAGFTVLPLKYDGTKYFIKFYPQNPNHNKATNVIADSLDIKNLPMNGYKEIPHK